MYDDKIKAMKDDLENLCWTANLLGYAEGIGAIQKYDDMDIVELCKYINSRHSMNGGARHITMDDLKRLIKEFYNERRTNL